MSVNIHLFRSILLVNLASASSVNQKIILRRTFKNRFTKIIIFYLMLHTLWDHVKQNRVRFKFRMEIKQIVSLSPIAGDHDRNLFAKVTSWAE